MIVNNVYHGILNIFQKILNISDQLIITFWSLILTIVFSNIFTQNDFVAYSLYYTVQLIFLLLVNSTFGQMLIIEGAGIKFKSVRNKIISIGITIFSFLIILLMGDFIVIDESSYAELIMFSISIALFISFELFRRYFYSLKLFKYSLRLVILLSVLLSFSLGLMLLFLDDLTFSIFLKINIFCYLIVLWVSIALIPSKCTIEDNRKNLTFSQIYSFSKWLIFGSILYIISNHLFIFYLNSSGIKEDVITLRLVETIFGIALVFCSSFENYFIAILLSAKFKTVLNSLYKIWGVLLIGIIMITPFLEFLLSFLFSHSYHFSFTLLMLILGSYSLYVASRVLVVYLRVNKINISIFYGNLFSSLIVIGVFLLDFGISLFEIFYLKIIFSVINIVVYSFYYLKNEKKDSYLARLWSR